MSGRDLRAELLQAEPPGAFDAEARAYRVAAHAFAERERVPRRRGTRAGSSSGSPSSRSSRPR